MSNCPTSLSATKNYYSQRSTFHTFGNSRIHYYNEDDLKEAQIMSETPFMKIKDAVKATGLSAYYLRNGIKAGTIPHIVCGTVYLVNVPALLEKLDSESRRDSTV